MHKTFNSSLQFFGDTGAQCLPPLAALHKLIEKQGYKDITLDFTQATYLNPQVMIPLATMARAYRGKKIDFDIIMPTDINANKLLRNANWAHLILPEKFDPQDEKNIKNVSAIQYNNGAEQFKAVDRSMNVMLQSMTGLNRRQLQAMEWALNEITDNVLNHAESPVGGIVQVLTFPKKKLVEFYVCDAGMGIPRSLRYGRKDITDDAAAVRQAIEEGVTKNSKTNQGNGLYGTFRCCKVSGGEFDVISGMIGLHASKNELHVKKNDIPFNGTFIRASINYEFEDLLETALIFKGKVANPALDYIERVYENSNNEITFSISKELNAFGTREAGAVARTKILNLMNQGKSRITFDFEDINVISSSFADEVFGKLYVELGPIRFGQLCNFQNMDSIVAGLIDRSITQRITQSSSLQLTNA